jgi:hypothetical protein
MEQKLCVYPSGFFVSQIHFVDSTVLSMRTVNKTRHRGRRQHLILGLIYAQHYEGYSGVFSCFRLARSHISVKWRFPQPMD